MWGIIAGPPGAGKTSWAKASMYGSPHVNVYTNDYLSIPREERPRAIANSILRRETFGVDLAVVVGCEAARLLDKPECLDLLGPPKWIRWVGTRQVQEIKNPQHRGLTVMQLTKIYNTKKVLSEQGTVYFL